MFWIARTFLCIRCFRKLDLMANTMWMLKHSLWTSDTKPCSLTSCFMHFGLKPLNWWALLLIDVDCMCRHRSSALRHVNAFWGAAFFSPSPCVSRTGRVQDWCPFCIPLVLCKMWSFDLRWQHPYVGQQGQHGTRNTMPVSLSLKKKPSWRFQVSRSVSLVLS